MAGVVRGADRLVQADRGPDLLLQRRVVHHVVPGERLLDHHQVEGVQRPEEGRVGEGVGAVRVDHEGHRGEAPADRLHQRAVVPGLDLDLDATVAGGDLGGDLVQERLLVLLQADGDAGGDLAAAPAQQPVERHSLRAAPPIPKPPSPGRPWPSRARARGRSGRADRAGGRCPSPTEQRHEEVAQDVEDGPVRLRQVVGIDVGHALPVAGHSRPRTRTRAGTPWPPCARSSSRRGSAGAGGGGGPRSARSSPGLPPAPNGRARRRGEGAPRSAGRARRCGGGGPRSRSRARPRSRPGAARSRGC